MKLRTSQTLLFVLLSAIAFAPSLAFAAYNDVTLTTNAIISVGSYTLNVSGSSAAVQSIVVNATSFSVTLASGSSLTVVSPTLQQFSSDVTSDVTSNICTGSASSITVAYSGAGTVTNVITPSATVCTGSGSTPAPGGGGGGAIVGSGPLAPGYVNTNPTTTTTALTGTSSIAIPAASTSTETALAPAFHFARNLQLQDRDADVQQLQEFLNTHGALVAANGSGSPGSETDYFGSLTYQALVRFQTAHAAEILVPLGLSKATGFFGAATRAYVNNATTTLPFSPASNATTSPTVEEATSTAQ